jgi:Domain of unknown function (DUF4350)
MSLLTSLDPKDRRMLLVILGLVALLFLLFVLFIPAQDPNNTVPSSYLSSQHGAKAAFTLLQQSGYPVERWEQPLADLAAHAGTDTVLILAEPNSYEPEDRFAIASILEKGGRVLATGFRGGLLLPGSDVTFSREIAFAACEADPDGLSPLAGQGPIWIIPGAAWKETRPEEHTAYTCAGQPVVVQYPVGKGTVVWWASSTPLENSSITRGQNLELLLNSIGPENGSAQGPHIYWDESLHGSGHSQWDYVSGPVWPLLSLGVLGLTLLVIFSYSRRSGPIRPLPQTPRTTPIEFLEALGSLYRSTGAAATAMQIAWERFRTQSALLTGQKTVSLDARQLAAVIERRFGAAVAGMEADLVAAEEACSDDALKPRRALALIQTLRRHEETMRTASSHRGANFRRLPNPSASQSSP